MPDTAAVSKTYTVVIENMAFAPALLQAHSGDRIRFVNKDLFAHTTTQTGGKFDSGSIEPQGSWTWVAAAGRWSYGCSFHPTMHGMLVVE